MYVPSPGTSQIPISEIYQHLNMSVSFYLLAETVERPKIIVQRTSALCFNENHSADN
jgi:hypothetical protein